MKKIIGVTILAIAGLLIAFSAASTMFQKSSDTNHPLTMAAERHVENVLCYGNCEQVLLVSDQAPGAAPYFTGDDCPTCIEASIWANETRDGQVTVSGYVFYQGVQENLRPLTFGTEVLDGRDLTFTLPRFSVHAVIPDNADIRPDPVFVMHLKDTGHWNLLDSLTCQSSCSDASDNFTIVSEKNGTQETVFDHCPAAAHATKMYVLNHQPDLHGPGEDDTYRVDVALRALPSTGSTTGRVPDGGFDRVYSSSELASDRIHVVADVGDTTFEFDLVK